MVTKDLMDENNHHIGRNSLYILVAYYKKKKKSQFSKQGQVLYWLTSKLVYVYPYQVIAKCQFLKKQSTLCFIMSTNGPVTVSRKDCEYVIHAP